jgi:hypothetical protein
MNSFFLMSASNLIITGNGALLHIPLLGIPFARETIFFDFPNLPDQNP